MKRVTLGNHSMIVLGTVQGLVKEKLKVKNAFEDISPEVVGLPISKEMLDGLEAVVDGEVREVATNSMDDEFADHLKRYGEVQLPPPSLVEAFRLAKKSGVKIVTLDMDEEKYSKAYTDHVSGYHFWKRIWNFSKLSKMTFEADTPEEFVVAWDDYATRLKGYANLEKFREEYMAKRALRLLRKYERVLVLVEYERMEGVAAKIKSGALEPEEEDEEDEEDGEGKEVEVGEGKEEEKEEQVKKEEREEQAKKEDEGDEVNEEEREAEETENGGERKGKMRNDEESSEVDEGKGEELEDIQDKE